MTEGDRRMITATLRFSYQVRDEDLALHIRDNLLKCRAGEILRGVLGPVAKQVIFWEFGRGFPPNSCKI